KEYLRPWVFRQYMFKYLLRRRVAAWVVNLPFLRRCRRLDYDAPLVRRKNEAPLVYGEPRPWFGVRAAGELRAVGKASMSSICFALRTAASTSRKPARPGKLFNAGGGEIAGWRQLGQ